MRSVTLAALVLLAACGEEETYSESTTTDPTVDWETDTDTDADTDSDTDADTDADTDTDTDADTDADTDTDYEALGGEEGVNDLLADFLGNVGEDSRINWFFVSSDLSALQGGLHDQICEATGGGCTYTGGDMATVHASMAITDAQFGALVEGLLTSYDDLGVDYTPGTFDGGKPADNVVLALAGMQTDIVTDADGDTVYFNQLGGRDAINTVVAEILNQVGGDIRISARFLTTDLAALQALLVDQICEATGGYCVYNGMSMADAHAGMCISTDEFGYFIEDALAALDVLGIPYSETLDGSETIDALLLTLLGMESDIVEDCVK